MGKYFNVLGHFFSIYCLWKIFICTVNIVFDRVGKVDPVTKGIEIGVHWIGLDMDVCCNISILYAIFRFDFGPSIFPSPLLGLLLLLRLEGC